MEKYDYLRKEDYSKFHGYAYDGLWSIALAIGQVNRRIQKEYRNVTLDNFQYRDPFWGRMFREALNQTSFVGVTVSSTFTCPSFVSIDPCKCGMSLVVGCKCLQQPPFYASKVLSRVVLRLESLKSGSID
jgi:hypothetical protein